MGRRLDTPGPVSEPSPPVEPGGEIAPLLIEIPLWRYGRVKFENRSQKASVALVVLGLLLIAMVFFSGIEALPGEHPGLSSLMDKLGQALLLVLGVLLGVDWKATRED